MFDLGRFADSDNKVAIFALNVISGVALVGASAWFVNTVMSAKDEGLSPRIVNSIVLEPTILLSGKPFTAHINVTLNRLCPYEVEWSLVRQPGGVEVVKIVEPLKQPPEKLGTQDLPDTKRFVPSSVEPGEYKYVSVVYDLCSDGHTYTSVRRNVDLSVR